MAPRIGAVAVLSLTALAGLGLGPSMPDAAAQGCFGVGNRIQVSGCTDPAPAPSDYAPLPEDAPPPPPPPPQVNTCVGYNGRWVRANNCN